MSLLSAPIEQINSRPCLHWTGSWASLIEALRELPAPIREKFTRHLSDCTPEWAGTGGISGTDFLSSGFFPSALEQMRKAQGKIQPGKLLPGISRPAISGGQWIIPQVLSGNPMSARLRERSKLPPRNIDLSVNCYGKVQGDALALPVAALARASWDYVKAGGIVNLAVHYLSWSSDLRQTIVVADGQRVYGVMLSVRVPLSSEASFSSACSVAAYRGVCQSLRFALGGGSRGHVDPLKRPGVVSLTGIPATDLKALQARFELV